MSGPGGLLAGVRILVLLAHPDDESLACGATLAWCVAEGAHVTLICATHGEAGLRNPGCDDEVDLGTVRSGELREATRALGIEDVVLLDHPDGELSGENFIQFREAVALAIRRLHAEAVITFGPDGLYWHPDHIYLYDRVTEAVRDYGPGAPALYYVVLPPGLMTEILDTAQRNPGAPEGLNLWEMDPEAFGAYAPAATLSLNAVAHAPAKLRALKAHRTQVGDLSPFSWLSVDQAARLLGQEQFVRAAVGDVETPVLERLAAPADAPR